MFRRCVRTERAFIARRCAPILLFLLGFLVLVPRSRAQLTLGPVTVGAGVRTSFVHTDTDGSEATDKFPLDSVRLYVNGPITEDKKIKFMFNTEYDGATNKIGVLDAVARVELSPKFNLWAGRVLPPSDRANLAGPYYNNHWGVYTDGIQNGHPSVFQGRDNGIVYWGDFAKKVKVSAGAFDGGSADGRNDVIGAARVQIDLWDPEGGYYLNSTYYGDKNLLSIGGATQVQSGNTATTVDFLLEKKLANLGVITVEGEYARYNGLGGYDATYRKSQGAYGLASYIFPKAIGVGKVQILGKYAKADFTHGLTPSYNQKTTEVNVNYLIREFNARVMTFFRNTNFTRQRPDSWVAGIGFQIQM
ncbi:MAG: Phosphate-selective porin [Bryobacterales bacterium]|nr:Phosphate-selective porin [Bryobacterales bacterium]